MTRRKIWILWCVGLWAVVVISSSCLNAWQSKAPATSEPSDDEIAATKVARSALELLHENQLGKVYREYVSDLQKRTRLTSEARFISVYGSVAAKTPGAPAERRLIKSYPLEQIPYFFGDYRGHFYYLVFLAKYPGGAIHEQVHVVKEEGNWKIATIVILDAL